MSPGMALQIFSLVFVLASFAPGVDARDEGKLFLATFTIDGPQVKFWIDLGPGSQQSSPDANANETSQSRTWNKQLGVPTQPAILITADGKPCVPSATRPSDAAEHQVNRLLLTYTCSGAARHYVVRCRMFDWLGSNHRTLTLISWPGGTQQFTFDQASAALRLDLDRGIVSPANEPGLLAGAQSVALSGLSVLCLLCIALTSRRWRTAAIKVGLFALSSSLAIAAAAHAAWTPALTVTISLMAVSVMLVAAANLVSAYRERAHWFAVCVLGVFHGFAFADVPVQSVSGEAASLSPWLAFGAGTTLGLFGVFLLLQPLLNWMRRYPWEEPAVAALSWLSLAAGLASVVVSFIFR